MALPTQVEEAVTMAEQLHAQMFNTTGEEAAPEEAQTDATPQEPEQEQSDEVMPHDDDIEELRKFKSRYQHLQGKYDAEVPRLHQELREFKQSVIEKLKEQVPAQQAQTPEEDPFADFKEEYGEKLFETMLKISRMENEKLLKEKMAPIQEQVASVEDVQVKAAQQNFVNYLDTQVKGDWKALWEGKDPKFIEFLQQPDPSGLYTYAELAQTANTNWDADRLGRIFNLYLDNSQASVPNKPKQPRPEQTAMVAPNRHTAHSVPDAQDKRIWSREMMDDFQLKDRKGEYSQEQSTELWNDLMKAATEGRIR